MCRLHEAPVIDQLDDIVIDKHRSVQYLTCHRINPRRAHSVHRGVRYIPDAGIFKVVRIELRILIGCREVTHLHHVLQSDGLEGAVPSQDTLLDRSLPSLRERIVHVPDNRILDRDLLTFLPSGSV